MKHQSTDIRQLQLLTIDRVPTGPGPAQTLTTQPGAAPRTYTASVALTPQSRQESHFAAAVSSQQVGRTQARWSRRTPRESPAYQTKIAVVSGEEWRGAGRGGVSTSPRHFGLNPWFATIDSRSALIVITIRPSENSAQISSFLRGGRCQSGGEHRGGRGVLLQRDLHRNDDRHWIDYQDQVRDDVADAYITVSVYFGGGGVGEPRTHDVELFLRGFTATYMALLAERRSVRRGERSLLAGDG